MSERVLVAGPYPTMGGPEAAATFDRVRELVRDGNDVVVVSPRPSAAHHHADPGSPRGAARLAGYAAGCDRMIVRLDASSLAAGSPSPRLLPARLALSVAVRRVSAAEVILDRVPASVASRWVSLVLAPATAVTVATEPERDALAAAGVAPARITVDPSILPPTPDRVLDAIRGRGAAVRGGLGSDAQSIEDAIRRRVQESRTPLDAGMGPGQHGLAAKPLRGLPPLERPQIRSRNPGYVAVKRVQLKLLSWMFDWVIQHVNRLHQATIEAIENVDRGPRSDSRD